MHPSQLLSLQEILAEGASPSMDLGMGESDALSPSRRADLVEVIMKIMEKGEGRGGREDIERNEMFG